MNKINFGDIQLGETARRNVIDCLDNNRTTMGSKVALFEREFARKMVAEWAVMTSSGTDALINAFLA